MIKQEAIKQEALIWGLLLGGWTVLLIGLYIGSAIYWASLPMFITGLAFNYKWYDRKRKQ